MSDVRANERIGERADERAPSGVPHPSPLSCASYSAIELSLSNDEVIALDQRLLPHVERYIMLRDVAAVADAIASLAVRGAPAIGIAAAYGMVLAARASTDEREFALAGDRLKRARPTAVNLAWAVDRMMVRASELSGATGDARVAALAEEARAIHRDDVAACKTMGLACAALLPDDVTVLTHCNAGALATGGYGTALGAIRAAREIGKSVRVIAGETRPVLQGARLTAWELVRDGFDVTLVSDTAAAQLFSRGSRGTHDSPGDARDARSRIDAVIVGADRIARNGDVANKIGTYGLSCFAKMHGVPFYVVAPWSTVDLACLSGREIPIEERSADEVLSIATEGGSVRVAARGVTVENPAFDVTPAAHVTAIVTERGVVRPSAGESLEAHR